jgi:release factor glutamine methyltransferase
VDNRRPPTGDPATIGRQGVRDRLRTALADAPTVAGAARVVEAALAAAGCVSARAEARWLLEEALGAGAGTLPRRARSPLDPDAAERLAGMTARRAAGEPLQYVIGWAPFGRLRLAVGPGVFVPRPETEGLADRAAAHLRAAGAAPVAVDLCTGSGAIACYLADAVPGARVLATELHEPSLAWARRNAAADGVEVLGGDLDERLPARLEGTVAVLTANVPYVPTGAMPLLPGDVREHEPEIALDGGPDGLDVLRRVVELAPRWLAAGGWILCEVGDDQGDAAAALLAGAGFGDVAVRQDLVGRDRVVEGRWTTSARQEREATTSR